MDTPTQPTENQITPQVTPEVAPQAMPQVTQQAAPEMVAQPMASIVPANVPMVAIAIPFWKNPRIWIAVVGAIAVIFAGVYFSKTSGIKGSFDDYSAAVDYKIQTFDVKQLADKSFEITYKIDKTAFNIFLAITKPVADDIAQNDDMVKLIALDPVADFTAGEHKIAVSADDLKAVIPVPGGTYRFQIIGYNSKDEITDFKNVKYALTADTNGVTLGAVVK